MEQDLATGVPGVVRWIEVGTRVVRVKGESRCFPAKGGWDASQTTKTLSEQVGPLCSVCWWEQPRQSFDEDLRSGALGRGNWQSSIAWSEHTLPRSKHSGFGVVCPAASWEARQLPFFLCVFSARWQNMARDTQRWSGGLSQRKPFLGPLLPSPRTPTLSVLYKSPMQDFVLFFFSEIFQSMWPFKYKKRKKNCELRPRGGRKTQMRRAAQNGQLRPHFNLKAHPLGGGQSPPVFSSQSEYCPNQLGVTP